MKRAMDRVTVTALTLRLTGGEHRASAVPRRLDGGDRSRTIRLRLSWLPPPPGRMVCHTVIMEPHPEIALNPGGRTAVHRRGSVVVREATVHTPAVHALLRHLEQ